MPGPAPGLLYEPVHPTGRQPLPPRRRPARSSPIIAPALALLGLLLVGGASVWGVSLLGVDLAGSGADPSATPVEELVAVASIGPDGSPVASTEPVVADPTDLPQIVEPPPDLRADVTGTLVFSRAGDIWTVSGRELRRLTDADSTKSDSAPTWSPDGQAADPRFPPRRPLHALHD
jgi:hypothetical protein